MNNVFNPPARTIAEWRAAARHFGQEVGERADTNFVDIQVFARDKYPIHCRVFNDKPGPAFLFYPGCSFIFDFLEVNSVIASHIAKLSDIKVVLINSRLAPENPVLSCLNDCFDAARYFAHQNLSEKLLIGGWSSGAHAATYVSNLARDFKIHHQILLAGSFDYTNDSRELDPFEAKDPTLDRRLVSHFASSFYAVNSLKDAHFSPFWRSDLAHFPPTTLLCGEFDAFRSDTENCFIKLQSSKVTVEKIILSGQSHNSIVMRTKLKDTLDPVEVIARVISSKL